MYSIIRLTYQAKVLLDIVATTFERHMIRRIQEQNLMESN